MKIRAYVGHWLRRYADRVDPQGAPRHGGLSFTFEHLEGRRVREDGRGCPLWYLGDADYERAHLEADTAHLRVNWTDLTAAYTGGRKNS